MRLVVDASVLVSELLRERGRRRLTDPRLDLYVPDQMAAECRHELPRRVAAFVRHRGLPADATDAIQERCTTAVDQNVQIVDTAVLLPLEDEARARCLCDPGDWPLVACALALDAGVWTGDNDLLGTGVPTWTTTTLQRWLDRQDQ